jgi:pyruvate dehydrogenase E1 component alpha subunit
MRMRGHAIHDNQAYVPRELLEEWQRKDPILRFEAHLRARGLLDDAALGALLARIEAELDEAQAYAESSPYPEPGSVMDGVYAPMQNAECGVQNTGAGDVGPGWGAGDP